VRRVGAGFLISIMAGKAGPAQLGSIVLAKSGAPLQARGRVKMMVFRHRKNHDFDTASSCFEKSAINLVNDDMTSGDPL
jgi:hypothetical protein